MQETFCVSDVNRLLATRPTMQTLPILSADATAFLLPDQPDAHYAQCRTAVCNEVQAKNTTTLDLVRVICHSCCIEHSSYCLLKLCWQPHAHFSLLY